MHCTSSPNDLFIISFLIFHRASQRNISIFLCTTNGKNIPFLEERLLKPSKVFNFHVTSQEGLQSAKQWKGPITALLLPSPCFCRSGWVVDLLLMCLFYLLKEIKYSFFFLKKILSFTTLIYMNIKELELYCLSINK